MYLCVRDRTTRAARAFAFVCITIHMCNVINFTHKCHMPDSIGVRFSYITLTFFNHQQQ